MYKKLEVLDTYKNVEDVYEWTPIKCQTANLVLSSERSFVN